MTDNNKNNIITVFKCVNHLSESIQARFKFTVKYAIGKISTEPVRGCPLFAYDSLDSVNRELSAKYYRILKCEAEISPVKLPRKVLNLFVSNINLSSKLFGCPDFAKEKRVYSFGWTVPLGTVLCKWVKPLEIVREPLITL